MFRVDEVRVWLEAARRELRDQIAVNLRAQPLLRACANQDLIEMIAALVEDTLVDGHFPAWPGGQGEDQPGARMNNPCLEKTPQRY